MSGRAREGAGVYLGLCIIHMHRYGTKTSTKERPQVPSVPTCFQSIIDGNTTHPILFPDLLDSIIVSIIKAISSKVRANERNISKHGASGCFFHWTFLALALITQITVSTVLFCY